MMLVHRFDHVTDKLVIRMPGEIIGSQQADYFTAFVDYRQAPYLMIFHGLGGFDERVISVADMNMLRHDVTSEGFVGVTAVGDDAASDVTIGEDSPQPVAGHYRNTPDVLISHNPGELAHAAILLDTYDINRHALADLDR